MTWDGLVILWTDALVFLLLVCSIAFGVYASRREHLRAPWRHVIRSKVGIGTLVVLLFYVVIGLSDSIHFHPQLDEPDNSGEVGYSSEVISLFDQMVTGLRARQEKTYSAPLATHLYTKETIELPDGSTIRDFPRLKHGGAHLADPKADWQSDILALSALGIFKGLVLTLVLGNILLI
ncbi:MAG: ABC transporter permease, partial [Candidatus Sedimenticola sp. PURPLELP]